MIDKLISTLEQFGFPVYRQGSLAENEPYPASFFTFWNNDTNDSSFYDNKENRTIWDFDVNFYTEDPAILYVKMKEAKKALKEAGFIASGEGYDVDSDEPTHCGRGMNALYIENNEK